MAIDAINAFKPDLVMLDWMMPKLDGPALFKQMQARPETQALPVVFITAKASQRDLDELMKLGAAATISKPFSPKDLPEQLRADLEQSCPSSGGAAASGAGTWAASAAGFGRARLGVELAREEADHLVGVAEARIAVLLEQLVHQALVLRKLAPAAPAAAC